MLVPLVVDATPHLPSLLGIVGIVAAFLLIFE
jgi:hypothetical protein